MELLKRGEAIEHFRSPHKRALGFVVIVALIMVGATTLGPLGAVVAPLSPSGGTVGPSALTASNVGPTAGSSSQTFTFSVGSSDVLEGLTPSTPSFVASAPPAPPAFDTDPAQNCTGGCDTLDWFGGLGGSGPLSLTTAQANELLVLEITDSGESGNALSLPDVSDTQSSIWSLEAENSWSGTGNNQSIYAA